MRTYHEHRYCVYSTAWSPIHATRFASASGDCTLKLWDIREKSSATTIHAHNHEILTCDWNKYNEFLIYTGSVDQTIKIWDIRKPQGEVGLLKGHSFAVRRIKSSPHHESVLASTS